MKDPKAEDFFCNDTLRQLQDAGRRDADKGEYNPPVDDQEPGLTFAHSLHRSMVNIVYTKAHNTRRLRLERKNAVDPK